VTALPLDSVWGKFQTAEHEWNKIRSAPGEDINQMRLACENRIRNFFLHLSQFHSWSDSWKGEFLLQEDFIWGRYILQVVRTGWREGVCFRCFKRHRFEQRMPSPAAGRNFGMSFALSLLWRKGRLLSWLFHPSSGSEGMYRNKCHTNMETYILYVTIKFSVSGSQQPWIM